MLTDRQKHILSIVVSEYAYSASPISSHIIVDQYDLRVSSATIRNELSVLEDLGFIDHPHTSAGRVPTDQGYRYYVDHLLERETISREIMGRVVRDLKEKIQSVDELMRKATKLLSSLTNQVSLIVYPRIEKQYFKKVSFTSIDEHRVVVVWISSNGLVWNSFLDLEIPLEAGKLELLMNFFNKEFAGVPFHDLQNVLGDKLNTRKDSLRELHQFAVRLVKESLKVSEELRLLLEGSRNVFHQPEFGDLDQTRKLLEVFEAKLPLLKIFDQSMHSDGLKVRIGQENLFLDMPECSLVTSTYRLKDDSQGVLGILGPKRMNYSRVISLVEFMTNEMEDTIYKYF